MIVDVNVSLSRWPFRRLPDDEPAAMVSRLRRHGVVEAWAGSFDGLLHRDAASVNARLAADCRSWGQGLLAPFGTVNPKLADWREDLRRCDEEHRMKGIRLYPNYHGYDLADAVFPELLSLAAARGLIVELALRMEDERTQHPLVRVPPVNPAPLAEAVAREPGVTLVLLHWKDLLRGDAARRLAGAGRVYFEISTAEGLGTLERLVTEVPAGRVLFGSNAPLFYFESALLKLREANLPEAGRRAVLEGNARQLTAAARRRGP